MKRILLFLTLAAFLPSVAAQAATLTDDFSQKGTIPGATYINLVEIPTGYRSMTGWQDAPDNSAFVMQSAKQSSAAIYYATGVREVEIDIYSRYGTFATADEAGIRFGIRDSSSISLPRLPLYISGSQVYASYDGGWHKMLLNSKISQYEFTTSAAPESSEQYGLSVYSSRDGVSLNALTVRQVSAMTNNLASGARVLSCFERYTAQVPANAKHIMIYLNDFHKIETTSGMVLPQESGNRICLAAVRFKGDNISLGQTEPQSSSSMQSSSQSDSKSKKEPSSKASSKSSSTAEKPFSKSSKADEPGQSRYDEIEEYSREDDMPRQSANQLFAGVSSQNSGGSSFDTSKVLGITLVLGGVLFLAWKIIVNFFVKKY